MEWKGIRMSAVFTRSLDANDHGAFLPGPLMLTLLD